MKLGTLIALAGCKSKETVVLASPWGRQPVPAGINSSIGPAQVGGGGTLRQSETVKVYGINRYVDAADSRVMHERHAVYRLEQQPAWVTRSPRNQSQMILGPIIGLRKPEYAPEPLPGETSREILQARRGIQEANDGMKDLRESQEKLTSSVEAIAKSTAEAERKLTAVVSVLNERVKHLEGDASSPEQPQVKTNETGENDVVVRSPNP
ncbi:MAG: hypothetical protein JO279_08565 [Verrucomicrobia bacterium]|nr:hypothetical protein [Verrucomicrobiota bacterium]